MKSKPETLQNRFIKETFAKNRMSKALFVQKKIVHGRTDRQTDRHRDSINYIGTRADACRPIAIYSHFLTLSLKISAN